MIHVSNLSKTYLLGDSRVDALVDVCVNINKGETVILSGPSGSGKSTLLQIIGCLDRPSRGQVKILDNDVNSTSDDTISDFRSRNLGFVFQTFNLIPVLNVYENVEYPLLLNKVKDRKERVMDILEQVGLEKYSKNLPKALSGGQRQRVAIARSLVHEPEILIADEPTANLDSKTGEHILSVMFNLAQDKGTTVILSSHDPKVIAQKDKRQIYLLDGKIVSDNPVIQPVAANF